MVKESIIRILLIEDEEYDVRRIASTLKGLGKRMEISDVVSNGADALELISAKKDQYDVVIMDFQISGPLKGEALIHAIKNIDPSLQIVVATKMTIRSSDVDFAKSLLDAGAFWYCTKYPADIEDFIYQPTDFVLAVTNAHRQRQAEQKHTVSNRKLQKKVDEVLQEKTIVGLSKPVEELRRTIRRCAESMAAVLISGPSGTGKELVAAHIHYHSPRRYESFIPVNCGGIPHELIESELFGYEKGAFTGAVSAKAGLFELAHQGTIFLDEVSALSSEAQVKLLRVLEVGEIEKIGRTEPRRVDVRVIAATNEDLEKRVSEGTFRKDLFYRLNVVSVEVPPLRDRREDISALAEHFLGMFASEMRISVPRIEEEALMVLMSYDWPGNVREFKNVMQRVVLTGNQQISSEEIRQQLGNAHTRRVSPFDQPLKDWTEREIGSWKEIEREFRSRYFAFVRSHSSSDAEAARKLGLAPPNFSRMCKDLGLKKD